MSPKKPVKENKTEKLHLSPSFYIMILRRIKEIAKHNAHSEVYKHAMKNIIDEADKALPEANPNAKI